MSVTAHRAWCPLQTTTKWIHFLLFVQVSAVDINFGENVDPLINYYEGVAKIMLVSE